jgi:hypothetical protein
MKPRIEVDPFTDNIIRRIDPKIRDTLSTTQVTAIIAAIRNPEKIRPIDIRGIIPLYFARYFFVLLIGRDKRAVMEREEHMRRKKASWLGGILFALLVSLPFLLLLFVFLYLLKYFAGVDIVPDFHLWEIFE